MSLFRGKNILKRFFKRPKINWSNYEFESSLLVNAVKHGNKLDPKKNIRVRRIITPNWCVWQIQDQGNGLEIKKRDYKLPKKISSVNGRGLYIINECFDDIRWSSKGNRLQLALKR